MSNLENIKNMNEVEMAEFLEKVASGDRASIGIDCGQSNCEFWKCTECINLWLKMEVGA